MRCFCENIGISQALIYFFVLFFPNNLEIFIHIYQMYMCYVLGNVTQVFLISSDEEYEYQENPENWNQQIYAFKFVISLNINSLKAGVRQTNIQNINHARLVVWF